MAKRIIDGMPLFFSIGVVGLLAVFGFSPLLLLLGVFIGSAIPGCDPFKGDEYYIVADSFNDSRIDPIKRQLKAMIPESAQMIRAEIREGGFFGGGRARVRCRVDPKAMLAFIKANSDWKFRFDSTLVNENKENPYDVPSVPYFSGDFWSGKESPEIAIPTIDLNGDVKDEVVKRPNPYQLSDKFWAYYFIEKNHGGYRLYYDVINEVFYYDWSSN